MKGDYSEHGMPGKYGAGCRCQICRAGNAQRNARIVQQLTDRAAAGDPAVPHGTKGGYQNWSCRCEACTAANTAVCRAQRANRRAS